MIMRVEFYKAGEGRLCGWIATPPRRRPFQGTTMAAGQSVPHDLMQFVVERALDIRDGFWGLLANGASFESVPGRRPTRPGRVIVRTHYPALLSAEGIVNAHHAFWKQGKPTPVGPALDAMLARWMALPEGEPLVLEWPVCRLPIERPRSGPSRAERRARARRARRGAA
jgi:hypothetical protein